MEAVVMDHAATGGKGEVVKRPEFHEQFGPRCAGDEVSLSGGFKICVFGHSLGAVPAD